jgi:hypothetical protein
MLANRIHPRVPADAKFREWRPKIHDAAMEALGVGG